jgi:hypothetical protein
MGNTLVRLPGTALFIVPLLALRDPVPLLSVWMDSSRKRCRYRPEKTDYWCTVLNVSFLTLVSAVMPLGGLQIYARRRVALRTITSSHPD